MRVLAIGVLLLGVGLVAGREGLRQDAPAAAPEDATPPGAVVSDLALDLARARSAYGAGGVPDIFSPSPPRSAAQGASTPRAAARTPPSAPPLPFAFLGRIVDEGKTSVFIGNDSESFIAAPGEQIAGRYRIESVGASSVTFVHLATGTRQVLALPAPE